MATIPRPEYPRPQFVRPDWLCLNGPWQFEIDHNDEGLARGMRDRELSGTITVPFCPESSLSGVGHAGFMDAVWYRRAIDVPRAWAGRRVLLWFQAVDYDATVWADGVEVARHVGGYTPFACDLGDAAGRTVTVVVRARDNPRVVKPRGKQCPKRDNTGCLYTRTTGIWQTVWLEPVPLACRLDRPRLWPDMAGSRFVLEQPLVGGTPLVASTTAEGFTLRAVLRDDRGEVSRAECDAGADFAPRLDLPVPADRRRLWSPDDPHLYDLNIELTDAAGHVVDRATSYAGLRGITLDGPAVKLNGRAVFQRLVLDQGFYPDGIYTAPTDEALRRDIRLAMAAGFNGARLHEKVFEERFFYHADRLGYLVWGEFPDWGSQADVGAQDQGQRPTPAYVRQWIEVLRRDLSHPSIVGWCPMNETAEACGDRPTALDDATWAMWLAAKAADPTRPVLDTSGYSHRVPESDVYDSHDYDQDPAAFKARHDGLLRGEPFVNLWDGRTMSIPWNGQPYFVSEFGGPWWYADTASEPTAWGYGDRLESVEAFYTRFKALCDVLLDLSLIHI